MKTLTTDQVAAMQEREPDFAFINVLPAETYAEAHIPGSRNIPIESDDFVRRVEAVVPNKDHKVVVYCASRQCNASPKAAEKLEEAGFSEVYDYEAGTEAWKNAGLPIESGENAA